MSVRTNSPVVSSVRFKSHSETISARFNVLCDSDDQLEFRIPPPTDEHRHRQPPQVTVATTQHRLVRPLYFCLPSFTLKNPGLCAPPLHFFLSQR
jgi:hypothetical protein